MRLWRVFEGRGGPRQMATWGLSFYRMAATELMQCDAVLGYA